MMTKGRNIFVAGHRGMVGSAIVRKLEAKQNTDTIITKTRAELDLTDSGAVLEFFSQQSIDEVYLAAARVGGIYANNEYPAEFIYQNLMIQCNVIHAAHVTNVPRLLFLGSSCIYPKLADQPMAESALLSGRLEETNEPYAIAKIAGIKMCESYNRQYGRDYRSVMPTNLYGPGDNFHPENSHVIPALLRRFRQAKQESSASVTIWGTGKAMREFLYVDDMADGCLHVMNLSVSDYVDATFPRESHVNLGTGVDCTIADLARAIKEVTGYQGKLEFDHSKPDGTPRKLLDVSRAKQMGWEPIVSLSDGLSTTWEWFERNYQIG